MKRLLSSKTLLFFVALLVYTIGNTFVTAAHNEQLAIGDINWSALLASVMGIVLRFFTNKPLKQ